MKRRDSYVGNFEAEGSVYDGTPANAGRVMATGKTKAVIKIRHTPLTTIPLLGTGSIFQETFYPFELEIGLEAVID